MVILLIVVMTYEHTMIFGHLNLKPNGENMHPSNVIFGHLNFKKHEQISYMVIV